MTTIVMVIAAVVLVAAIALAALRRWHRRRTRVALRVTTRPRDDGRSIEIHEWVWADGRRELSMVAWRAADGTIERTWSAKRPPEGA